MKNLILGIALVGLAVGCKSDETNQVSDGSTVSAPEAECQSDCGDCPESMCDAEAKAECQGQSGCEMSAGCDKAAAGCDSDAKVCPITGEVQE